MAQLLLYVNILMLIIVRTNIFTYVVDTLNHCAIVSASKQPTRNDYEQCD